MTVFADLYELPEDQQIDLIRATVLEGNTVGIFVDDFAKADRYLRKLGPMVREISRTRDLVKGSVFVKLGPRLQ
jgi:hypothetical protein